MSSLPSKILTVSDNPRFIMLKAVFNVRGEVFTNVKCECKKNGDIPSREVVNL